MTNVKICGITNLEDGINAVNLGADYIGFVFYEKSPRNVTPQQAKDLSEKLTGVKKVGLFVDENPQTIAAISDAVGLDVIQLHGNESPNYCFGLVGVVDEIWKAIRVKDEASVTLIRDYESADAFVLDAHVEGKMGGTGKTFDWDLAKQAKSHNKRIILAGGLDPSNVREAIVTVNPWAVDVSSGVEECKGKKSYDKMRAFIKTAKIPSVLLKIVRQKEEEVALLYNSGNPGIYARTKPRDKNKVSFYDAIAAQKITNAPNLIAEFKITSPSNVRKGNPDFRPDASPEKVAKTYKEHGASAMSVLTDANFKGSLEYLYRISQVIDLPLLRKDFIIDSAQIYEARRYGADAILLIAAILDVQQMKDFISVADKYGMDCLVESHNKKELEKSIAAGARIYGINNRNLHDFTIDRNTTLELLPMVPEGSPIVTESGILTYDHVKELSHPRINAMLVGETLMRADDIGTKMYELLGK
jgi:indole-3-glycerol phosphate synthase